MRFLIVIIFFSFFPPFEAEAYLDPGTGGMLVQLLMAGIAGAFIILKIFWKRILSIGKKKEKELKKHDETDS